VSKARNRRAKRVREGGLDPTISRGMWLRKPQTQVVPNKKAESRRAACRRWQGRGECLISLWAIFKLVVRSVP